MFWIYEIWSIYIFKHITYFTDFWESNTIVACLADNLLLYIKSFTDSYESNYYFNNFLLPVSYIQNHSLKTLLTNDTKRIIVHSKILLHVLCFRETIHIPHVGYSIKYVLIVHINMMVFYFKIIICNTTAVSPVHCFVYYEADCFPDTGLLYH